MIPSGYSPMILISITIAPTPIPKIHMPFVVSGAVTGSVAMKNAQRSIPPVVRCVSGEMYASGFMRYATPAKMKAEIRTANGMCIVIVFLINR